MPSDHDPFAAALDKLAACDAVAAALKSLVSSVVEAPNPPILTSTQQMPCVPNGFVPLSEPRRKRRVTDTIVAVSGIDDVSKATMVLYCLSLLSSPTRSALVVFALLFSDPPVFEASVASSTQPSCASIAVKTAVVGPPGWAGVADAWFEFCPIPSALVPLTR